MLNRFFAAIILCMASISCVLAQTTVTYTTTADGSKRLEQTTGTTKTSGTNVITIKDERYQDIDGFGYAITYSAAYNLLKMEPNQRTQLLTNIFSKTRGYGVNYIRMSIGCSDFSSTEYTYCDVKGPDHNLLQYFKLHSDERDYVLPVLREIKAINPDIKIMAAPWTCPRWMKVNNINDKAPYNSWTDGRLNPDYRQAYANYFVKFIKAMQDEGFNIYAVTPQNEPLNGANCASLVMPWQEEADFVKVLAKTFHENSINTRIYLFDHNFNYDNKSEENDYSLKIFNYLGTGYTGEDLVVGTAWHDYGGEPGEMSDVHNQYPTKEQIFTEESIGEWNDGRNVEGTLVNKMKRTGISFMQNWSRAVMVWNLMLDDHKAPNLSGGCQTCFGAVDIDRYSYSHLTYNNQYYVINHLASVINPGAYRVSTDGWYAENMEYLAFRNPDGTCAMIFASSNAADQNFSITDGSDKYMDVTVPANGIVSVKFGAFTPAQIQPVEEPAQGPGIYIIGAHSSVDPTQYQDGDDNWLTDRAIEMEKIDDHTYHYTFEVGKTLNPGYVNFKFFGQAGWGIEYKPGSEYSISTDSDLFGVNASDGNIYKQVNENLIWGDKYTFTIDASNPNALKLDVKRIPNRPYSGIWIIGANVSIGPKEKWAENNWGWSESNAIQMTETDDYHYSYTFTVGENLNPSAVNFKFFGQAGWGNEFKDSDSPYIISTASNIFGIGTGKDDHDNGNIYLKNGNTLTTGDRYTFDIDVSDPYNVILTITKQLDILYSDIYIIGAMNSVGDYIASTSTEWEPTNNYKLSKISNTEYQYTFTVGENLNPNNVNFKFFGQAGWGIEFTSNGIYRISTTSDVFGIGNGTGGHDNGNIYLRSGKTLTPGDKYVFTIDASNAYNVVLSIEHQPAQGNQEQIVMTNTQGTYSNANALSFPAEPDADIKAYIIKSYNDSYAFLTRINDVPANTGLFIKAKSAGTYMVNRATNAPAVSGNFMRATVSAEAIQPTDNGSTNYYFSTTSQSFVRLAKEVTMPANRAYLQLPGQSGAKPLTLVFDELEDDIVTDITEVRDSATIVYDLNGRRLSTSISSLPAGIYIVNGKKVRK